MLIEFNISNYLSIKRKISLDMRAASISEHKDSNLIFLPKFELLKSAAIYGANASGKTNLIKGIRFMKSFVMNSSTSYQVNDKIDVTPFRLNVENEYKPSFFEVVFYLNMKKYRYGFEVSKNEVFSEWLYEAKVTSEKMLFKRKRNNIEINKRNFKEGAGFEDKTRNNALFLSVCAQFNGNLSISILNWFSKLNAIHGIQDELYEGFTINMMKDNLKDKIIEFVKKADMNILDINVEELDLKAENITDKIPLEIRLQIEKDLGPKSKLNKLHTIHNIYNEDNEVINKMSFNLNDAESEGTKKFFRFAGPIIDTLINGKILVVDEFDAKMHPLLTKSIVKLFNSSETNQNNAQLIFATHDTNLLSSNIFRRDQIWFTEKDHGESTDLYSLVEFKISEKSNKFTEKDLGESLDNSSLNELKLPDKLIKVRKDASFENDYLRGRYGAIPFIFGLNNIIESNGEKSED
ncbi:MAG TPA: ATP-binding protein [Ignavibacteria bacterium]